MSSERIPADASQWASAPYIEPAPLSASSRQREDVANREIASHVWEAPELVQYLQGLDDTSLFEMADFVRRTRVGDVVHLRGLIEFANCCRQNCLYCGLRQARRNIERYRLTLDEIVSAATHARVLGYGSVVLQSGEDPLRGLDELCRIVERIRSEVDLAVTLSVGERSRDDYCRLKAAGADRYLLRFETSDAKLFSQLRPGRRLDERLRCIQELGELGYQVGSGCMIGLPGQTFEMLASDLLLIQKLNLDMIGVGPFLPNPETPLAGSDSGDLDVTLRFVALLRLMNPICHIPATPPDPRAPHSDKRTAGSRHDFKTKNRHEPRARGGPRR